MNGIVAYLSSHVPAIPIIIAQGTPLDFKVFESSSIDSTVLVYSLIGIMFTILMIVFGTYRYKRWKKFKEFETEMKALDLEPEQEGTLAEMVKRYSMDEPVNILFSARLFDEMASSEIKRVLGSAASIKLKQEFIDKVYFIRTKTYHPDWLAAEIHAKKAVQAPKSAV